MHDGVVQPINAVFPGPPAYEVISEMTSAVSLGSFWDTTELAFHGPGWRFAWWYEPWGTFPTIWLLLAP